MIRLLIVDDQPSVRKGLHMLLTAESDITVIGEAASGEAALALATLLKPDVVLMDVEIPGTNGIATTCALQLILPQTKIIVLSMHDDQHTRARAEKAGAAAFVSKSMPADALLTAIRQVAGNGMERARRSD